MYENRKKQSRITAFSPDLSKLEGKAHQRYGFVNYIICVIYKYNIHIYLHIYVSPQDQL